MGKGVILLSGTSREFARRFAEGIRKLAGNTPKRSLEEDWKTHRKNAGGCRIGRRFGLHSKKIDSGR
ncbi:hypothetical protein BHE74_00028875 [Ensete ventricosum]|nr:hypothetical protein GW17_00015413 [Ensete ventricosum]RWW63922.1 hypothetical protein BHE74_00028875 [Ensete ventricosum]RZR91326.1 hypothetical protein BHM03_00019423 [Ensete ventricosum]